MVRGIVHEIADRLLGEAEIFKSLDHALRAFDSALFSLHDLGLLSEENVECLLNYAGPRLAPYLVLMRRLRDEVEKQRVRYRSLASYLDVFSRYAAVYERMGIQPAAIPLGFHRPPPTLDGDIPVPRDEGPVIRGVPVAPAATSEPRSSRGGRHDDDEQEEGGGWGPFYVVMLLLIIIFILLLANS